MFHLSTTNHLKEFLGAKNPLQKPGIFDKFSLHCLTKSGILTSRTGIAPLFHRKIQTPRKVYLLSYPIHPSALRPVLERGYRITVFIQQQTIRPLTQEKKTRRYKEVGDINIYYIRKGGRSLHVPKGGLHFKNYSSRIGRMKKTRFKMDNIESQIKALLNGKGLESHHNFFCDFTLNDQNEVLGVQPTGPTDFVPVTKKSVTYIVAAVLVNEDNQVLMIQEAKASCSGQWYLPAGRMEPGETIYDAVKREVMEETGIDFEPTTLLMAESAAGSWFRFVLTGNVLGGRLKTPAEADSESLQAKWVSDIKTLQLRSSDILPLIQKGVEYHNNRNEPWHAKTMPTNIAHKKLYMRFIIGVRRRANNRVTVLVSEKDHVHIPVCEINPQRSVHSTIKKYMTEIFGADLPQHRPHGLLSLEYNGAPAGQHDGICLNIFISIRQPVEEVPLIDKYSWKDLNPTLGEELLQRIGKNQCIPLHVIR
ncbi:unnamed protein product [Allacma fusca]|uniref:Nudix hydrolase domain-containing protein n=1 Tax=Allacma fusca TaxID=39272 RepID=A0A8J2LDV8_9HEXA|nr:unnamed protein product [Allacma fusca]